MTLRPVSADDADLVWRLYSDPQTVLWLDLEPFTEHRQAADHLERWLDPLSPGFPRRWVIETSGGDAGTIGWYAHVRHQGRATVGYDLLTEFRGQGLASTALGLLEGEATTAGIERLQATVLPGHGASTRVLEKAGYTREGCLQGYEVWPVRGRVDLDLWAKLLLEGRGGAARR
jgi:RimJ/RimL family protein N-acetyltransferase